MYTNVIYLYTTSGALKIACSVNIILGRILILADKVGLAVAAQPAREFTNFLSKPRHGLLVHIGLC